MTSVLIQFEEKTQERPEALAVSFAGRRMTYACLNEEANQIAFLLRDAGVHRESLVAVYLERSPKLIAALLGIWKAGGAYLPIDPTNPRQRVASTLSDSEAAFVLTERKLLGFLPPTGATLLCVDDPSSVSMDKIPSSERSLASIYPSPEQLAYVIYTSGSTGRPKGAEIAHGSLSNLIAAIGRDVALQPSDVVLASATVAFDIANMELFLPLVAGASVHVLEQEFVGDGSKLVEVMRRSQPSLVFGTPTSWRLVLEAGWQGDPKLQVVVGGEVLPLSLARTLAGMTRAFWNHYGPTETAICATRERIDPNTDQVTLGWPVDNVTIYVLDQNMRPVPTGEVGEIYIGGAGVGRGYRNRTDLTESVFLEDPFSASPGSRMYKTGDLGRLLPDGRLDFQGRVDNQIKLRGFRIELEEIEAAIRSHQGVHAAVVQVVDFEAGDQRLVAYFLAEKQVVASELRETVRKALPYYMLPSELIPLDSLPMTINGKVDREALRTNQIAYQAAIPLESLPPADEMEAKLLRIWKRLLKVRNIGPKDDFFDMGGHSLLATRMFAEIEKISGRKVPLSVLIQNPTVAELSSYLRKLPETDLLRPVPIREHGSLPPLFIAHGLGSHLLLFRVLADELGSDQPVYGIQLAAPVTASASELSLEFIAARNVEEICALDPVGPYYLAGHSLGGLLVFEIAAQLLRRGKEIGLLALLDCALPETRRSNTVTAAAAIPLRDLWLRWQKKFSRLFEGGLVTTTWRRVLYNQLMVKIWLLKRTYSEGSFYPEIFGMDPYIALFAERYDPQPIDVDGVFFVATDEVAPESAGMAWSRLLQRSLTIQKVPGSHRTIFSPPHVSVLASELANRLHWSSHLPQGRAASKDRSEPKRQLVPAVLGYHRG